MGIFFFSCLGCDQSDSVRSVVVTTLEDPVNPPLGMMTLRSAVATVKEGEIITFAPELDGGTIALSRTETDNTLLKGEVFTMAAGKWFFGGYQERNYGRSALYARKNIIIDASALPHGITLAWSGGRDNGARVLAVYGDLTMKKVTVSGGAPVSVALVGGSQPYTLARGGGLAVWGMVTLEECTVSGNQVVGDLDASRDRGAFGGGIYANLITLKDSIVAGNSATGFGAAGGGIYSVGGAELNGLDSRSTSIEGCAVTGNSVTAQHAYGGGVYSDGGGPGSSRTLNLTKSTIARNLVQDHPDLEQSAMFQYYYRGGGIYMSNGSLALSGCTVAENAVNGIPTLFRGKPNIGGGGIGATIGDAHVVENMRIRHSIVVGNTLADLPDDLFTGSLMHFFSEGYNLIGKLDFSQILVPIPPYDSLCRRHWPKAGDQSNVLPAQALKIDTPRLHSSITSVGTDAGAKSLLWYPPGASAIDKIPVSVNIDYLLAEYELLPGSEDDFLNYVLVRIRNLYGSTLGNDFAADLGDLSGLTCNAATPAWPSDPANTDWINFWRDIEGRIGDQLGPAQLGEDFWGSFASGPLGAGLVLTVTSTPAQTIPLASSDQLGMARPLNGLGDIGAIEVLAP